MLIKQIFLHNLMIPQYNNNFRYKSDYTTDLTITQYNEQNQASYSVNLYEAYPVSINDINLDWSQNNTLFKPTVTYTFKSWYVKDLELAILLAEEARNKFHGIYARHG